jgi:hypothetical protein
LKLLVALLGFRWWTLQLQELYADHDIVIFHVVIVIIITMVLYGKYSLLAVLPEGSWGDNATPSIHITE